MTALGAFHLLGRRHCPHGGAPGGAHGPRAPAPGHVDPHSLEPRFPSFCVLLPASVEEIRVIGALQGEIQQEQVNALLAACMEDTTCWPLLGDERR